MNFRLLGSLAVTGFALALASCSLHAQERSAPIKQSPFGEPPGVKRLAKEYPVWFDPKRKLVIVDGEVSLTEGPLEMFACLKGTKEHESVVALNTKAYYLHAGLLSVGAKSGSPAKFKPEYKPASGTTIEVIVLWFDKEGKRQQTKAQELVRNAETKKKLSYEWVFAGGGFWLDEQTGIDHYLPEGGDVICVSNFPSAMLDLPVESTQANQGLLFEANPETVPPRGTPVRVILRPKFEEKEESR